MHDVAAILVPAVLAGLVAIAVTAGIERFGGVVGGLLGTLPTTIVPASIGLWAASEPHVARDALCAAPTGMLVNAGFLWLWRVLPSRLPDGPVAAKLLGMVALTLLAWAAGATAMVAGTRALLGAGAPAWAVGTVATGALAAAGVLACLGERPAPAARRPVGAGAMLARGLLAAVAIGAAVAVGRAGDGLLAGVASTFPAIFLTAMAALWWSHGDAVPGGAVGPMMLGSTAVAVYALGAALCLPALGLPAGALLPWGVAACGVTAPAVLWQRARAGRGRDAPAS